MRKQDCRPGMKVLAGRPYGEKTLCRIEKLNPKTAVCVTLESRGMYAQKSAGLKIKADYSLLYPADAEGEEPVNPKVEHEITYSSFHHAEDVHILLAMFHIYVNLSPENLSCDGELPRHAVATKLRELNRKLRCLQQAIGTPVNEEMVYEWKRIYDSYQRQRV